MKAYISIMTGQWSRLRNIIICLDIFIMLKVSGQSTSLTIFPTIVNEGSSQTMTCKYNGSEAINSVAWFANDITQGVLKMSGVCSELFWRHKFLHSYSCDVNKTTFNLTILSVKRSNWTDLWRCQISFVGILERENSNFVIPSVRVFVTSVKLVLPQTNTVTVQEWSSQLFRCISGEGFPEPIVKWYNNSKTPGETTDDKEIISMITPSNSSTNDGLIITTSTLTFTASKYDNQISIYCSAYVSTDQTSLNSTQKPKLNVLYDPDGPPKIQKFAAGEIYKVIESRQGQLTCYITGGNPSPTLAWTCYNTGSSDNTGANTVSMTTRWAAVRGQDRKCTCRSSHASGNSTVEIQIETLYPPSTPDLYINSIKVSGTVKVIRDNPVSITCKSSGNPNQIKYTWKHGLSTTSGAVLTTYNVTSNDEYTCEAENAMDQSDGSPVLGKNASSVRFEVLYPPEVYNLQNQSVPEGSTFIYDCPVKYGNPNTTSFKWSRSNGTIWNLQKLTIKNVSSDDVAFYICTVENTMKQTGEQTEVRGSDTKPDQPTSFSFQRQFVTDSSFNVEWRPGSDNGPKQNFILMYRKESQQEWTEVTIPDSREALMNYTLSNLSSGTDYQIVLYASNKLGNSTESDMLTIFTKYRPEECICSSSNDIAVIVGVVFGLVSVVVSVYASYVTVLLRRNKAIQKEALSSVLKGNVTSIQTYANLTFNTDTSSEPGDTARPDTAEYTTLDNQLRNDNSTYDHIEVAQ